MSAPRVVFRVLPDADGWRVTRSTAKRQPKGNAPVLRALGLFRWGWQAILFARGNAKRVHSAGGLSQVIIHGRDGRIKTEWTYGADPERSKG